MLKPQLPNRCSSRSGASIAATKVGSARPARGKPERGIVVPVRATVEAAGCAGGTPSANVRGERPQAIGLRDGIGVRIIARSVATHRARGRSRPEQATPGTGKPDDRRRPRPDKRFESSRKPARAP